MSGVNLGKDRNPGNYILIPPSRGWGGGKFWPLALAGNMKKVKICERKGHKENRKIEKA
jgi:hypothetical protein